MSLVHQTNEGGQELGARSELTAKELAWKIEGTRAYQDLAVRSLNTMREVAPLAAVEPDRARVKSYSGAIPKVKTGK